MRRLVSFPMLGSRRQKLQTTICVLLTVMAVFVLKQHFSESSINKTNINEIRVRETQTTIPEAVNVINSERALDMPDFTNDDNCEDTFEPTLEKNLEVIESYPDDLATDYLWKLGTTRAEPLEMTSLPVVVTAIDKDYYSFSQGMFLTMHKGLMKYYDDEIRFIVYDLGLTNRQRKLLHERCRCELREFPFSDFPPHVRSLKTYAFKPIIVQHVLMEFGFVWWVDSSIKFTKLNIDDAISYTKNNSILFFVSTDPLTNAMMTSHTDLRTFNFFKEDLCKFRQFNEVWATTAMFHYDQITRAVVLAWAKCALNEACIAPAGTQYKLTCGENVTQDGHCHRFDQSALSIILRRVYHKRNIYPEDSRYRKLFYIFRHEFVDYFERCRFQITCY